MCGIILLQGPNASARLPSCLERLKHRGPDGSGVWMEGDVALGFTRLAINGEGANGQQPHQYNGWIGAINGEIYNYEELAQDLGRKVDACDAYVFLPLLEVRGLQIINELDGFYSAVTFHSSRRELLCFRDHIGKKPLFVGRSQNELFITSELKALDAVEWFKLLPRGVVRVELGSGNITHLAAHQPPDTQGNLADLLEEAVRKRMPRAEQPLGLFLSGGLDSSLIASLASRLRDDIKFFTLGNEEDPDRSAAQAVVEFLGLKDIELIPVPSPSCIPELVRSVVYATESYNPSIVSNGLATFLLAQAAHERGIKVVLTGEGADELFGGYHSFCEQDPWRETRARLIDDMHFTELRRLDMGCMAHGVEARCPFLDRTVRRFSDQLSHHEMYDGNNNKISLRHNFEGLLPAKILKRTKTSFDVGSGIRREVLRYLRRNGNSEREELFALWRQLFAFDASAPYFHSYPVFDAAIDRRGELHR